MGSEGGVGVYDERDADVENSLRAEGSGAADLEGGVAGDGGGPEGGEEGAGGANVRVRAEEEAGSGGVDVDGDGGGVGAEDVVLDAEDELVVPRGFGAAGGVDAGASAVVGADIRDSVGAHRAGGGVEVLGRDQRHFHPVVRMRKRGRVRAVDIAAATGVVGTGGLRGRELRPRGHRSASYGRAAPSRPRFPGPPEREGRFVLFDS